MADLLPSVKTACISTDALCPASRVYRQIPHRLLSKKQTMHTDLHTLQIASMAVVFALIFSARLVKGHPRKTPAGLAFPLKPLVIFSRAFALPLYFLLFAYPLWISRQSIPAWLLILLFIAVIFGLYQYPGTIILTPTAVIQRFWFRAQKSITYPEIMTIGAARSGAVTTVLGDNRVTITHTSNHAGAAEFRAELARLSGKQVAR